MNPKLSSSLRDCLLYLLSSINSFVTLIQTILLLFKTSFNFFFLQSMYALNCTKLFLLSPRFSTFFFVWSICLYHKFKHFFLAPRIHILSSFSNKFTRNIDPVAWSLLQDLLLFLISSVNILVIDPNYSSCLQDFL